MRRELCVCMYVLPHLICVYLCLSIIIHLGLSASVAVYIV